MVPVLSSFGNKVTATRGEAKTTPGSRRRSVFKELFSILNRKEKRQFIELTVLDVVINVVDILSLALLLWIVQFYVRPGQHYSSPFLQNWLSRTNPVLFLTVFFLLFSVKNLGGFLIARKQFDFIGKLAVRISSGNLSAYQNAGFEQFVTVDSSVHIRNIAYQPFDFCQYMVSGTQQIITQISLITISVTAILLFNAQLFFLLFLILVPPVLGVFYFLKLRLTRAKTRIKLSNQRSFQYLMDALKAYIEGNLYDRNLFFHKRFLTQRKVFSKHLFDSLSMQTLPSRLIEVFALLGLFFLIVMAKWSGSGDGSGLITIGAFMAAAYKIIPGIVKIVNVSSQMKAYDVEMSGISGGAHTMAPEGRSQAMAIRSLGFSGVHFEYNELAVLKNLSFHVREGDFLGISGRSGKGKTTIFNLLLGFLSPSEGKVFINGVAVEANDIRQYWPSVSYVKQQSFFIHDTILRNVTLEEDGYDSERLETAIRMAGLEEFIREAEEGLDKIITENGRNISGGQQQRISVARALYKNADLFLLDEPFNELDEVSENALLEHFRKMAESGKIVIMITHNVKALSYCNKIISLDEQKE